ncbi:MAG: hypothetical protein JSS72_12120 [Armatimonadetes bacterium]|nr:hypothetical protein [Armatimonadota bacterium]
MERRPYEQQFPRPQPPAQWRRKGGLQPPVAGKFIRERYLSFAPPVWYDLLVIACIVGGLGLALAGMRYPDLLGFGNEDIPKYAGGATFLAGLWAAFSNERMRCDLRNRTYSRLEGHGPFKRVHFGHLQNLHALVLYSENYPIALDGGRTVVYRLVLYWKGSAEPLLVVEQHYAPVPTGAPLNYSAGYMFQQGQRYAHALGIPFVDRSMVHSPAPLAVI